MHGHRTPNGGYRPTIIVGRPAFTLIEMLIAIVILAICYGLVLPSLGNSKGLRLREAARMLAADLELAQTESVTHGGDPRIVKFDTLNQRYWIAPASTPNTPITDPVRNEPFLVAFGTGRASAATGVTIRAVSLGGDSEIHFDPYGSPDQSTNATVTLACGTATMTVQVQAGTGEVTISSSPPTKVPAPILPAPEPVPAPPPATLAS